jgi:hypothetical protein
MGITKRSRISRLIRSAKDIRRRGTPVRCFLLVFLVTVATFCLLCPVGEPITVNYTTQPAVQEHPTDLAVKILQKNTARQDQSRPQ